MANKVYNIHLDPIYLYLYVNDPVGCENTTFHLTHPALVEQSQKWIIPGWPPMSFYTKCEHNPISGFFANARKLLDQAQVRKRLEIQWSVTTSSAEGGSLWVGQLSVSPIWSAVCLQRHGNTQPTRPGNSWSSVGHNQEWTRPGKINNVSAHQIWVQSNQWFVCTCSETSPPTKAQEIPGNDRNLAWQNVN